jgi:hypothetical protein
MAYGVTPRARVNPNATRPASTNVYSGGEPNAGAALPPPIGPAAAGPAAGPRGPPRAPRRSPRPR